MGADLYINSLVKEARAKYDPLFDAAVKKRNQLMETAKLMGLTDKAQKAINKAQEEVEKYYNLANGDGYFRDSYNDSSLFWMLGLSWWQMAEEGLIDDRGYISPENAFLLAQLVKDAEYVKPIRADLFGDTETVFEVKQYFDNKKKNFIKFLMLAVEMDESIYASV